MTTKEIQSKIFEMSGIKTSTRKGTGSMKGYIIIWPIFQDGEYPKIPASCLDEIAPHLAEYDKEPKPVFCSSSDISVYGLSDESIRYKRESKPTEAEEKEAKTWGSKNSQVRLDKAVSRYGKRLRKGGCARYN